MQYCPAVIIGGNTLGRRLEFTVPKEYDGKKVIHLLRGFAGVSARTVGTLKRTPDGITLNGAHIRTIDRIKEGDVVAISLPEDGNLPEPADAEIDVIYEDSDILAVNKSPFMAMHPTHNHQGDTLANAVAGYLKREGKSATFRAVGRLDKGTSGIVICALNRYAAARIPKSVEKEYLAVVNGCFEGNGTIDVPIYRPDPMKTLRACGDEGETAVTHWQSLFTNGEYSLMKIRLETGRTHQIRVHFAHLGAPLVGDSMYGEDRFGIGHQLLHCARSEFAHPVTGGVMILRAKPPEDFVKFCQSFIDEENFNKIFN